LISTSCLILMILSPLALNSVTLVMISVTVILRGLLDLQTVSISHVDLFRSQATAYMTNSHRLCW
jgi:hypothetical protein